MGQCDLICAAMQIRKKETNIPFIYLPLQRVKHG